jgi:hypothetical protein
MGRRENGKGDRMGKEGKEDGCVDGDIDVKYCSTLTDRIYERRKGWCTALHRILLYCAVLHCTALRCTLLKHRSFQMIFHTIKIYSFLSLRNIPHHSHSLTSSPHTPCVTEQRTVSKILNTH